MWEHELWGTAPALLLWLLGEEVGEREGALALPSARPGPGSLSVPPPPKLCPPLGGQQVEGGGRGRVSSCKEGWVVWQLLELRRGAAGRFLLPNALPLSKPLRARLSLSVSFPPSLPLHHPTPRVFITLLFF